LLLALGLCASSARAEDSARARAERIARALESAAADRVVVAPVLARARHALERAANARRAGDHRHGSELEALALELAQSAADMQREKVAQTRVSEMERKALDAETRLVRARALVEQTAARRGRAAERLRELETEKAKPSAGAKPKAAAAAKPAATSPMPSAKPAAKGGEAAR
jgi:colicin import membrane protein